MAGDRMEDSRLAGNRTAGSGLAGGRLLREDAVWGGYLDIWEERRRGRSVRRARKAERRWIALTLERAARQSRKGKIRALTMQAVHLLLWLFFGAGALGLSGALLLSTGVAHREQTEGPSLLLDGEADADWEREFFGVRIQLRSGQITIFREKEEAVRVRCEK